jgi:hypothetical protein
MIRHFAWVSAPLLMLLGPQVRANLEQLPSAYHFVEHKFAVVDLQADPSWWPTRSI